MRTLFVPLLAGFFSLAGSAVAETAAQAEKNAQARELKEAQAKCASKTGAQKDRGRGVARGNIREIVQASFGYAFLIYAIGGGLLYLIWRTANAG